MAYVPQFEHDIFVSYRRVSNEGPDRWVDAFCDQLRIQLKELVGDVAIWRDSGKLADGDLFHQEIARALDKTAIFLAIISGTYFDSAECVDELDRFLGHFKSEAGQRRIVPVLKQPIGSNLPPELGEIDHRQFFEFRPKGSDQFVEFRPDTDEDTARLFASALAALAQDLRRALKTMRGEADRSAEATVYLAEVGPDLRQERVNLAQDLQQRGYRVVPDRPILWNSSNGLETVQRNLDEAQVSVHLLSSSASLDAARVQSARRQLDLAVETMQRRNGLLPLVWFPPADQPGGSLNELVTYVQHDLANQGVEYSESSFEDFKSHVFEKLPRKSAVTADVAVIVEEHDLGLSAGLMDRLTANLRIEPKRTVLAGTAPKDAAAFARTLDRCPRAIVLWASQSEDWLTDVLALDALAGHSGPARLAVYVEGPSSPERDTFRTSRARLISAASPNALDQLSDLLGRTGTRR